MKNRLIIFEDDKYSDFYPLTLSRPVFSLRCGMLRLWEKVARRFPGYEIAFSCRPELASLLKSQTGCAVNAIDYQPGDRLVFVNGRLRLGDKMAHELTAGGHNRIYIENKVTAAIVLAEPLQKAPPANVHFTGAGASEALGIKADLVAGEFEFYNHLWDCVNLNPDEIAIDFLSRREAGEGDRVPANARIDSTARILSRDNLLIASGAEIGAGVVIDNRSGPVVIDRGAGIGPLSFVEGPCYIGPETKIYRGNIRAGCSFGPSCRIGGEVEQSIFHGYSNKYHDGFMGHAYIGSWVNLGAMTTNSDLKNNYKNISVSVNGRTIDTGLMKVGSFIGDHSKTGIGTLLNTGVSIGFSCNLFGAALVTSREVSSFSWGDERGYDVYRLDKAVEVAMTCMARRGVTFTDEHHRLFASIYEKTTSER